MSNVNLPSIQPVVLARYKGNETSIEDYNQQISANENCMQQNFNSINETLRQLKEALDALA